MSRSTCGGPIRVVVALSAALLAVSAFTFGSALASNRVRSHSLSRRRRELHQHRLHGRVVGRANGAARALHPFFCAQPPVSMTNPHCEAGDAAQVTPPSGPVVSNMYVLVPLGFSPPGNTLHCPIRGRCIDQPGTIDVFRLVGWGTGNIVFPRHRIVLEEDESFQSTWWPVVLVGPKNLVAWNQLATAKSAEGWTPARKPGTARRRPRRTLRLLPGARPGDSPQGPALVRRDGGCGRPGPLRSANTVGRLRAIHLASQRGRPWVSRIIGRLPGAGTLMPLTFKPRVGRHNLRCR